MWANSAQVLSAIPIQKTLYSLAQVEPVALSSVPCPQIKESQLRNCRVLMQYSPLNFNKSLNLKEKKSMSFYGTIGTLGLRDPGLKNQLRPPECHVVYVKKDYSMANLHRCRNNYIF